MNLTPRIELVLVENLINIFMARHRSARGRICGTHCAVYVRHTNCNIALKELPDFHKLRSIIYSIKTLCEPDMHILSFVQSQNFRKRALSTIYLPEIFFKHLGNVCVQIRSVVTFPLAYRFKNIDCHWLTNDIGNFTGINKFRRCHLIDQHV